MIVKCTSNLHIHLLGGTANLWQYGTFTETQDLNTR